MLSRLYQSARAIFNETPRNVKIEQPQVVVPLRDDTMVTTRQRYSQGAVVEEVNDENTINVYVPNNNDKRQKRIKDEDIVVLTDENDASLTPTGTRKRKRLPVRAKDVVSPDSAEIEPVVEIPAKKLYQEPDHGSDIIFEDGVAVDVDQKMERDAEVADSLVDSKHLRFGSEQAEDEFFSTAREVAADDRMMHESEDSEDDAPEVVSIQQGVINVKLKDRDAAKAVKQQLSATRKKRKERDDALKKQAESSKKRKLEADDLGITKLAERSYQQDSLVPEAHLDIGLEEGASLVEKSSAKHEIVSGVALSGRRKLPHRLPAEYLEDTEPQEVMLLDALPRKKSKKTKFQDTTEKIPKDRRIGSTTYRVIKAGSINMAPKLSSQARNTKEAWLNGRSRKGASANRKPFSKGFFKK